MLRPILLALCLGLMPMMARAEPPAGQGADLSEEAYRHDVAEGARLAVKDAELTLKYQAGKISARRYDEAEARVRKQSTALSEKWAHGVNNRASVQFASDVWDKSYNDMVALRGRYASAAPKATPAPPAPKPAFDPYVAAQAPTEPALKVRQGLLTWLLPFVIAVMVIVPLLGWIFRRFFPSVPQEEEKGPEVSDNYGSATYAGFLSDIPNRAYVQRGVFFGKSSLPVADPEMREAVASYMTRAAEKLRRHSLKAAAFQVFMHTNRFNNDPAYSNQRTIEIEATADSFALVSAATRAAEGIWRDGFRYAKAGIVLVDLYRPAELPASDMFATRDPAKSKALMTALDAINGRFAGLVDAAGEPLALLHDPA
ncbi:hypothetical protein SAMN07250955_1232 [Arboricoccus pini]|uniref:DNA polymerase Y-family little finger domain-containing protein n=1 Tax=Arboricoccus pini TaxID=1963835 RepID=A0A212S3Z9_9PROT|nr:hypothetical protein [Arboricoccus pini]SNB79779.1 hypothetical protein SAMN07250955_1232 [Arboricoccus pini]